MHELAALGVICRPRSVAGTHGVFAGGWLLPNEDGGIFKTVDAHLVRALIVAPAELVAMHRDLSNQVRGVLKVFGLVVGPTSHGGFGMWVRELVQSGPEMLGENCRRPACGMGSNWGAA